MSELMRKLFPRLTEEQIDQRIASARAVADAAAAAEASSELSPVQDDVNRSNEQDALRAEWQRRYREGEELRASERGENTFAFGTPEAYGDGAIVGLTAEERASDAAFEKEWLDGDAARSRAPIAPLPEPTSSAIGRHGRKK